MTQYDFGVIDPDTSGIELADMLMQLRDAIHARHSGPTRPSYAVPGLLWVQEQTPTQNRLMVFTGSGDIPLVSYNPQTNSITDVAPFLRSAPLITSGEFAAERIPRATQAEAEAGVISSKLMTPLRVAQAIAARVAGVFGTRQTLDLGTALTTNLWTAIRFYSANAAGVTPAASINRNQGADGALVIDQQGNGVINVSGGSTLRRNGHDVWHDGNRPKATVAEAEALTGPGIMDANLVGTAFDARQPGDPGGVQDVTAQRTGGTVYQNTWARPRYVSIYESRIDNDGPNFFYISHDGVTFTIIGQSALDRSSNSHINMIAQGPYVVPPGWYYRLNRTPNVWWREY
ncbi:hypothetical protein [Pseudaestuariivita rosea]|uniref:hypothetical protein n=1 Tax=Pseudaestuariivita rosea TaxID=2763263 RepID=UPI001ABB3F8D|nr:hypothetical protein [Pseudaestuariivita rosea]